MPSPCNNVSLTPIKVSQLVRYQNIDPTDFFLTIESGSSLYSRRSTFGDLVNALGTVTGSYSGSFTGSFDGVKSKISGSFSGSFYGTSVFAKTASYLLQTSQNTTNQVGYFDGTRLRSAPGLIFQNNVGGTKALYVSSSLSFNYLVIASRGAAGYNQAGITLSNFNNSNSYPNQSSWTIVNNNSGSLTYVAPIGSHQFNSATVVGKSTTGECYGMVQMRNGFYFWPYASSNSPSRDGAIGIGVQPPNEPTGSFNKYLRAKLQINMFSGSGEGPWSPAATVENRSTAILVNYGSSSVYPTFFVSASGNTYVGGKLTVNNGVSGSFSGSYRGSVISKNVKITGSFKGIDNILNFKGTGKKVSVNATSSYAVSSSYALSSSYVINGLNNGGFSGLSSNLYQESQSPTALSTYVGSNFKLTHGFGSNPSVIRITALCISADLGYSAGDEVDISYLQILDNDWDRLASTVWSTSTEVGVAFTGDTHSWQIIQKTGGTNLTGLDRSKWKIKIRAWK